VLALLLLLAIDCDCDPARPESLKQRQCSLCNEAEKQPPGTTVFFLKDINPRKPNRWLALPRKHGSGAHHLHDLTHAERTELWTAAIAKAKELFGDEWGVAYNGEKVRTQCHTHLHIGRFVKAGEQSKGYIVVRGPAEIPAPPGAGIWVHPAGGKLHVHFGEQITETVLVR
jgi:diadenosine tetraphosphate (Ap4A) HIT family hydrolase